MLGILGTVADFLSKAGTTVRVECVDVIEDAVTYLSAAFTPLIPGPGKTDTVIHKFRREVFRQELLVDINEENESDLQASAYMVEHAFMKIMRLCKRVREIRASRVREKSQSGHGNFAVEFEREYINHTDDTDRIKCATPFAQKCKCDPESSWIEREKKEVLANAEIRGEGKNTIHHDDEKLQVETMMNMWDETWQDKVKAEPAKPVLVNPGKKKGKALKDVQQSNKAKQAAYERELEEVRRWNAGLNIEDFDFNLKLADCYRLNRRGIWINGFHVPGQCSDAWYLELDEETRTLFGRLLNSIKTCQQLQDLLRTNFKKVSANPTSGDMYACLKLELSEAGAAAVSGSNDVSQS